jgi:hypothetical protein
VDARALNLVLEDSFGCSEMYRFWNGTEFERTNAFLLRLMVLCDVVINEWICAAGHL